MIRYVLAGIASGVLFGILDVVININPIAQKLLEVYKPIARKSINPIAGIAIDLFFGFAMAMVYILLFRSLPGESGIVRGLSFGLLVWFFRVVMYAASHWMMFKVPVKTLFYTLVTGLVEMLILGMVYGLVFNLEM